ncbi:hypothetical protein, partial [Escherichia coli]|uniref:hypothetical protein n=1 Tax=Escherichia coli TaxID=562 RepID=UPI001BE42BD8
MARDKADAERDKAAKDAPDTVLAAAPPVTELAEQVPSDAEVRTPPKVRLKDLPPVYRRALRE